VVKGWEATIATRFRKSALNKVDFPTLGNPTIPIESDIMDLSYHKPFIPLETVSPEADEAPTYWSVL